VSRGVPETRTAYASTVGTPGRAGSNRPVYPRPVSRRRRPARRARLRAGGGCSACGVGAADAALDAEASGAVCSRWVIASTSRSTSRRAAGLSGSIASARRACHSAPASSPRSSAISRQPDDRDRVASIRANRLPIDRLDKGRRHPRPGLPHDGRLAVGRGGAAVDLTPSSSAHTPGQLTSTCARGSRETLLVRGNAQSHAQPQGRLDLHPIPAEKTTTLGRRRVIRPGVAGSHARTAATCAGSGQPGPGRSASRASERAHRSASATSSKPLSSWTSHSPDPPRTRTSA
jgi:hypothetical protein